MLDGEGGGAGSGGGDNNGKGTSSDNVGPAFLIKLAEVDCVEPGICTYSNTSKLHVILKDNNITEEQLTIQVRIFRYRFIR